MTYGLRDLGIFADGKTDCTAAMQRMLNVRPMHLPWSDMPYVFSSLVLNRHLTADPGTVILKNPASDHNEPLILGNDREFSLNNLTLRATKPTPNGVFQPGPQKNKKRNIVFWRATNVSVYGVAGGESIGVLLTSSEATINEGANYASQITNLFVAGTDYGIRFTKFCNAHTLVAPVFYEIGKVAIDMVDCTDNTVVGGFVHRSYNALCVRMRNCKFIEVNGFIGEPGKSGKFLETDDECEAWAVRTQDNCTNGPTLKGKSWRYESHGLARWADGKGRVYEPQTVGA